jgi:UMF1 family MFS transporter
VSVGINAIVSPILGALSDRAGRRLPFLFVFTALCVAPTAVIGFSSPLVGVLLFALANFAYQAALIYYDASIRLVSTPETRGRVSGLGVGIGYFGTVFSGLILFLFDIPVEGRFVLAAVLYALLAIPIFLVLREPPPPPGSRRIGLTDVLGSWQQLRVTIDHARDHPGLGRFLVGRFFYSDAIATLSAFLTVYMTRLGGFSETEKNGVLAVSVVGAAAAALVTGRVLGRTGPRAVLLTVLPVFTALTLLSAAVGEPWTVWLAAPAMGSALGCVWTADRVFMLRLTPLELRGQMFGFFNLASRVASAFGPLVIWSAAIWLLHSRTDWLSLLGATRVALVGLALTAFVGWLVIRPLSDDYRRPSKVVT